MGQAPERLLELGSGAWHVEVSLRAARQIEEIRTKILGFAYVSSGKLLERL